MFGAIAGDVIGSVYETAPIKTEDFELFSERSALTDDSVMTVAVAEAILRDSSFAGSMQKWGRRYPSAGYGGSFYHWLFAKNPEPYNSWGNGAAMRVSPVGFVYKDPEKVKQKAAETAAVSHNHPEGIKGAQATAMAVFYARKTKDKGQVNL